MSIAENAPPSETPTRGEAVAVASHWRCALASVDSGDRRRVTACPIAVLSYKPARH